MCTALNKDLLFQRIRRRESGKLNMRLKSDNNDTMNERTNEQTIERKKNPNIHRNEHTEKTEEEQDENRKIRKSDNRVMIIPSSTHPPYIIP